MRDSTVLCCAPTSTARSIGPGKAGLCSSRAPGGRAILPTTEWTSGAPCPRPTIQDWSMSATPFSAWGIPTTWTFVPWASALTPGLPSSAPAAWSTEPIATPTTKRPRMPGSRAFVGSLVLSLPAKKKMPSPSRSPPFPSLAPSRRHCSPIVNSIRPIRSATRVTSSSASKARGLSMRWAMSSV